jgi:hypothetical protein
MIKNVRKFEKGQSLVVVTLLLIVFIGMLALALDGGYTFFMRRNAQNAADAGALAAADTWCETEDWDTAYNAGKYYAEDLNNADDEESIITSPGERLVRVETNITFDTFFGRLLGRDQITAVASATAGCYPPALVEGVIPVAWSCREPNIDDPGPGDPPHEWGSEDCEYLYGDDDFPYSGQMYIIMDANKLLDDYDTYAACQDPALPPELRNPDLLDCDIDDDGINDILTGGERSWLDLDGGSSDANELRDWVLGTEPVAIQTHLWLVGSDGGKTMVYQAVETMEGEDVILPVFDHYCDMKVDPNSPTNLENTVCYQDFSTNVDRQDDPHLGETTSGVYFHISTFAVFHIECVSDSPSKTCPVKTEAIDAGLAEHNTFSIEGYFVRGYIPSSGGPNQNPWVGSWTVYLID